MKIKIQKLMAYILIFCMMGTLIPGLYTEVDAAENLSTVIAAGYTYYTNSNGVMAYRYNTGSSYNSGIKTIDIRGYFANSWRRTSYGDKGFLTYVDVDGSKSQVSAEPFESATALSSGLKIGIDVNFMNDGKTLQFLYTVNNTTDGTKTFSIGTGADIQIGNDDYARITPFDTNGGFKMVSTRSEDANSNNEYAQFNFFGKGYKGVTSVTDFWYGAYSGSNSTSYWSSNYQYAVFYDSSRSSSGSFDSAASWHWSDQTLGAGQTKQYSILIGIGGAESEDVAEEETPSEYTVSYNSNGGVGTIANQSITASVATKLTKNTFTKAGYTFKGWATTAGGNVVYTDEQSVTDIASAGGTITLYAVWEKLAAKPPVITYTSPDLTGASALTFGNISGSVYVVAEPDGGTEYTLSYQWYKNTTNSVTGATKIDGEAASTYTIPTNSVVGDMYYYCVVTAKRNDNGNESSVSSRLIQVTVNKAIPQVTPPVAKQGLIYSGTSNALVEAGSSANGTMVYCLGTQSAPGGTFAGSIPEATDAGIYYVWYKVNGNTNYADTEPAAVIVSIAKASVAVPAVSDKVYTGQTLKADIYETNEYTVVNGGGIDVGEYDVVLSLKDSANYKWAAGNESGDKTLKFKIIKSETTFPDGQKKVLNGSTETTEFTYGDTVTVKIKPTATGVAVSGISLAPLDDPGANQMALYIGNTRVSDIADADGEGYYTMNVNTKDASLTCGSITFIAKYVGNANMADCSENIIITLNKAPKAAPTGVFAVAETIKNKNDGKITGVDSAMEYRADGETTYTAIDGTELANLAVGKYYIRYAETDNYLASDEALAEVTPGRLIQVTFDSCGGSDVAGADCAYMEKVAAPQDPVKEGFEFVGWYTDNSYTTKWDFENDTFDNDKTLYAKWVRGIVASSDGNVSGVEASGLNDVAKAENVDISLVVESRERAEGNAEQDAIAAITDALKKIDFYDFSLVKSVGGNITDASSVIEIKLPFDFTARVNVKAYRYHNGNAQELTKIETRATAPFDDGKFFMDEENGFIYIYTSKFSIYSVAYDEIRLITGDSGYYSVLFRTNGGTSVKSRRLARNTVIEEPEDPIKPGYVFDGWYADKALTKPYTFGNKITSDVTIYAKWISEEKINEHVCPSLEFGDLDVTKWYHEDTDYVIENGLMNGMAQAVFGPDNNLTRGMLVTILYRNEGSPAVNRSIPFEDVDMSDYYANAVIWAKQNGVVNGISDTEFAPNVNITREQIAAIMHRYASLNGIDVSIGKTTSILSYSDSDSVSDYAVDSMKWAVGSGLIKGRSSTTLNPKDNATRVEIAAILHRFIEENK